MKKTIIKARCISPGVAEGEALVSKSRISFWARRRYEGNFYGKRP